MSKRVNALNGLRNSGEVSRAGWLSLARRVKLDDGSVPNEERTMVRIMTRTLAAVVMAAAAFAFAGAPAGAAPQPIGPNQHFAGGVNGTRTSAVVYTACSGPTWAGRTGPVAGGQTLSVVRAMRGHGYTGLFSQIYAWFVPQGAATTTAPVQLKFTSYNAPQKIPTSVKVPCDGTGQVEFSSCPYLAPCAYGWVPDYVTVQFVNIAL